MERAALDACSSKCGSWTIHWVGITKTDSITYAAKSLQWCPTLCDPIDGSPPGSSVPGILQATTLEWVAISFSSAWKWKVKVKSLSRVRLLATPWTAAYKAPPSMGFSRQEYWSRVPLPSPSITFKHIQMQTLRPHHIYSIRTCILIEWFMCTLKGEK